ncbi:phage tail assembly chaperone [Brevundimonas sp. GCM10030266]|uniref:phage tail assembly chaperone n=1 Tax=Brevundimonas sp. GCM10030266 TaxID=3273386 RepID=UPI0036064CB8
MKTPWGEMLRAAARSGVTPAAFWSLSLREWRLLTSPGRQHEALSRDVFERLAEAWPDD